MGFLGHSIPSLNRDFFSIEEGNKMPQKAHLSGSKGDTPKRHILTPNMSFSRFSNFGLCTGTLGSQSLSQSGVVYVGCWVLFFTYLLVVKRIARSGLA